MQSIKLRVVLVAVLLARPCAAFPSRFPLPIIMSNLCSVGAHNAVGMDSSVLIRRGEDNAGAIAEFCDIFLLNPDACHRVRREVDTAMETGPGVDAFNWIMTPGPGCYSPQDASLPLTQVRLDCG